MKNKENQMFFSTTEVAKLLKISRIAVFNKIKKGLIKAKKMGRGYAIPREEIGHLLEKNNLSDKEKIEINDAVEKAIREYGETIRLLGKE